MVDYISIKQVLDDLLDHPMLQDLSFERAVNYAVHFIQIIGVPNIFEEKSSVIKIKDYRGLLPCDFYNMIQVRAADKDNSRVYRYSNDSFHHSYEKDSNNYDLTYKIQNTVIFTSNKDGDIEIAYHAIKTDEEGYPLIPKNSSFIQALELYIKKKVFTILFDQGKLNSAILQNTQQEYAWYVGQAQRDLSMPTIDQMESITNMMTQLLQRNHEHSKGFKALGSKEIIKIH